MPSTTTSDNRLISALPVRRQRAILRHCEPVTLEYGEMLAEAHAPIRHVYFPLDAFISQLTQISNSHPGNQRTLELGLVGSEGMLGVSLALGIYEFPLTARVQGQGEALRMSASALEVALQADEGFHKRLLAYHYVRTEHLSQIAACSLFHEVNQRLARWLLISHDAAHGGSFKLTQALMSRMLGVRRSAVSIAASHLKNLGHITYSRGFITVLDRPGLEQASCRCYAAWLNAYERILGEY